MSSVQSRALTILYADDDADDRFLLSRVLEQHSPEYHVVTAVDGVDALRYLQTVEAEKKGLPCLIVLDLNMPRLNGRETFAAIRSMPELLDIPIVFFTTSSSPHDKDFAASNGAGFFTKPVDPDEFTEVADELVNHCR